MPIGPDDASPPTSPEVALGAQAVRGGGITVVTQAIRSVIQLVGLVVLARLVPPEDVGIMALALVVTGFGEIIRDFGLSTASVQAEEISPADESTLFWLNAALGTLVSGLSLLLAPFVAELLGEPRLTSVIRVLSISLMLNALSSQYQAHLTRKMRFGSLGWSEAAAAALGLLVATVSALAGAGYWALVLQQLTASLVVLVSRATLCGWLPSIQSWASPRRFIAFGLPLFGTQSLWFATQNLDNLVIGRQSGPAALGPYARAFQLLMLPVNQLGAPLLRVTLPILSRVRANPAQFHQYLLRGQLVLGYAIVGVLSILSATADPLLILILGTEWSGVVTPFRILAVGGAFQALTYVSYWVFVSKGLTRPQLAYSVVARTTGIAFIGAGSWWGTNGVAVGVAAGLMLNWPLSLYWLHVRGAISAGVIASHGLRILAAGAVVLAGGLAAGSLGGSDITSLALAVSGSLLAIALLQAFPAYRADRTFLLDTVHSLTRGKRSAG